MKIEQAIERQIWYIEELRMLMKIPGIGKVSAWTILAEIGDIKRFPSHKQFVSYCRLVPGSSDSAGKRNHKSRCKDGNKYLKTAFMQAAIGAYSSCNAVQKYHAKFKKRRPALVARTIVAK